MRINFISSSLSGGGAERVMVILANYFVIKGHEVTIITFNNGEAFDVDQKVNRVKLHSGSIKNHTIRSLKSLISYYRKKANRPDIAISFICAINFVSIIACRLFAIKIIVSEHNNHYRKNGRVGEFTWNYLYRLANTVTVLTSFDKPFFEKKGSKVVVMPNPYSFIPLSDSSKLRKKIILAVGNCNRYHAKGFDNLIALIPPVLKKYPNWILKIVGGGDQGLTFLKELAIQNGVEPQVQFTGFSKDVGLLMKVSEIFILSSRYEGLPMALLEAMSQGMACIAYDCVTGPSEIIVNNTNGLLIEDQNVDAMQKGLIQLIGNDLLRKNLGYNAISSLERYSIENIYKLWEKLFQQIL
ncbi:MAG: glycosyltransferase family 4 protein [Pyrinomonadaceae bacterium]|nr:glycosyltransferase family 4 protein [Sphingobacteriaceae bacterium]